MIQPTPTLVVLCANCRRKQIDEGVRKTCAHCGCFPLPSYSFDSSSSFHPSNCGGVADKPRFTKVNYKRITPKPQLKLK